MADIKKESWLPAALIVGISAIGLWLVTFWLPTAKGVQVVNPSVPAGIRVKTINPKMGAGLGVSVEQPAEVAPYYRASLFAKLGGTITFLEKDIGDKVTAGEKLIELDPTVQDTQLQNRLIIKAPFDGVIATRSVDPGTFVPSAAIVPGSPALLVIEKTDIVTVSMQVPDSFVAYVSIDTEAEIRMDSFPGRALKCKLSRLAPSLNAADRTLRVEVDLYNGTEAEHRAFLAKAMLNSQADLKSRKLPVFPTGLEANGAARLLPGMYGRMRLNLREFKNTALIPSGAIVRLGGVPYLYRVDSGVAHRARVSIELDGGTLARVFWLERENGKDISRELNPNEEIILSNQGELEEGTAVVPMLSKFGD
ncbi:MAG: HlyD family efflux transporter periplasmic adaptor subunit [Gemmataceae bacterium]|nr:HlyD family efflux transporter periplasmic adaptor subunit [Gemmataceae bacterium]